MYILGTCLPVMGLIEFGSPDSRPALIHCISTGVGLYQGPWHHPPPFFLPLLVTETGSVVLNLFTPLWYHLICVFISYIFYQH